MLWKLEKKVLESLLGEGPVLELGAVRTEHGIPGDENAPRQVNGALKVHRPAREVFEIVADPASYTRFMRQVDKVRILDRNGNRIHSFHRLKLKLTIVNLKLDYEVISELQPDALTMSFRHWAGQLSGLEGSWVVRELDARTCAAFHSLIIDFREAGLLARKALQVEPALNAALQTSTVVMTLEALKQYLE
jgi:ribosome-associated toxin RatA of RatAB toxin-antitoxin module